MKKNHSFGRRSRAIIAAFLSALMLLVGVAPASAELDYTPPDTSPFSDVHREDMFYDEIAWLYEEGITTGYPDGTFHPGEPINRDAMAAFLYRFSGEPDFTPPDGTPPFSDVPRDVMFFKEIAWLYEEGITTGYPDGTFHPGEPINRDALAAFIYRFAGEPDFTPPDTSPFSDVEKDDMFYKEITWAYAEGITTGYPDGTFHPVEPINRDAMAAFLFRLAGIEDSEQLTITTTTLPSGTVGQPYEATLAATGGTTPYTWQATNLPAGLTLTGDKISGTPTATGPTTIEVTVTGGGDSVSAEVVLSVVEPLLITTTSLPVGSVDQPYEATLTAEGGVPPASWTALGLLPEGLGLAATGTITGTPTSAGSTTVTFMATDLEGREATADLTFDISEALVITNTSLPPSTVGDPYQTDVAATGGTAPYTWEVTDLPDGLSFAAGKISGAPTEPGTFSVSLKVTDAAGRETTARLDLVVSGQLTITTSSIPAGRPGTEYSATLAASGGVPPYSWSAVGLPAGLTLDGNTISGVPGTIATADVTVTVTDADERSTSTTLRLVVEDALAITTTALAAGTLDEPYSFTLTGAGGTAPYTWTASPLPPGLTLTGDTIAGTPTEEGTTEVVITLTDSDDETVNATMALAVSDVRAGLTLVKTVVNSFGTAADPSDWELSADGPGDNYLSGDGAVARTAVPEGDYALSETGSVHGYTNGTTWSCIDANSNPVTVTGNVVALAAGDDVTCSITNTATAPYLSLEKMVSNPYGTPEAASKWTLSADGPDNNDLLGTGGVARTAVVEGTYTLSETGSVPGYTNGTTWTCVDANAGPVTVANNSVTLAAGDDVTCSITNTATAPYLSLEKKVTNPYGTPEAASKWTLSADGPGSNDLSGPGGVARTAVVEGTYTLSETGSVPGYTNGTTWSCANAAGQPVTVSNNVVTLTAGADVTCSITNTASQAHLTLVKRVQSTAGPAASASNWILSADGPGSNDLSGPGGVARTAVVEGTYTLSETGSVPGYSNGTTWSCIDASSNPVPVSGGNKVTLSASTDVVCTITNTAVAAKVAPGSSSPTPVYRYNSTGSKDWVGVPDHGDFGVPSGYGGQVGPQFYVPLISSSAGDMRAIYRWYHAGDRDWVDMVDGEVHPGYTNQTFQYYLFTSSGTGRTAVYRWWHPSDKDWLTVSANELSDATLQSWGYRDKVLLGYAHTSRGSNTGYFTLGTPQAAVVSSSYAPGQYPHTMSVLDVNPSQSPSINAGYRYLGYFGHNNCGGINIARSNNLDSSSWNVGGDQPWFGSQWPCRWAFGAIVDGSQVAMVVNGVWDDTITLQMSRDGLNGTEFPTATTLVQAPGNDGTGNPTLFRDPTTNRYYLYYYRVIPNEKGIEYLYEIRVKSATTIPGLIGSGSSDLGTRIALSRNVLAAPSTMYVNGIYYLSVETKESGVWKTRVMTGTSPTGPFYEVPGNPLYGDGAACVFQHQFGNELHSWYCKQTQPGNEAAWRLDHVKGNLLSPN
ncbi:MAG TPA: putative Ig domain-containing protein [Actinomycetaceae bacterium]|nr:putative Ig domain-containing protein [Actinomycetaceae bacterium]